MSDDLGNPMGVLNDGINLLTMDFQWDPMGLKVGLKTAILLGNLMMVCPIFSPKSSAIFFFVQDDGRRHPLRAPEPSI